MSLSAVPSRTGWAYIGLTALLLVIYQTPMAATWPPVQEVVLGLIVVLLLPVLPLVVGGIRGAFALTEPLEPVSDTQIVVIVSSIVTVIPLVGAYLQVVVVWPMLKAVGRRLRTARVGARPA